MNAVEVFAPGKLFVIGEYAVLHGGRALIAALDAGITCRIDDCAAGEARLSAPDLGLEMTVAEARADSRSALLAEAVDAGAERFGLERPIAVTVRGNRDASRRKLGLGGSAASVVAILAAIASAAGEEVESADTRERLFQLALAVHRKRQAGRGSGGDVAASVYGGWVDYALGENGARIAPAGLPADVCLSAVWSGVASDTARAIGAFEGVAARRPAASGSPALLARLRAILERFWTAVAAEDRPAMLAEIDAYGAALDDLAAAEGGRARHRVAELARVARANGVAAKGSGAVGGDCVIAVAFDPADLAGARDRWRKCDAEPLEVSIDRRGVRRGDAHA